MDSREGHSAAVPGYLELEDGQLFPGRLFGAAAPTDGEVVFNTGMVGYVESLTDPSYRGQILTLTYPLVGNYGVPDLAAGAGRAESDRIQVRGLVVAESVTTHSHWEASISLDEWLAASGVTGLAGIDTRHLTQILREKGTMLGRIGIGERPAAEQPIPDPNATDLVRDVTCSAVEEIGNGGPRIVLVDCGSKLSIIRQLQKRGCRILRVPYDYDLVSLDVAGFLLSNGPGDPVQCAATIRHVRGLLDGGRPVAGICLGCQIMALAAGARTYKLRYGHRGQNQPVRETGTGRCRITSQNHGYAVDAASLPSDWSVWCTNLNDGTVEGIRHASRPLFALQYHPEASPGPTDSVDFFDLFLEAVRHG